MRTKSECHYLPPGIKGKIFPYNINKGGCSTCSEMPNKVEKLLVFFMYYPCWKGASTPALKFVHIWQYINYNLQTAPFKRGKTALSTANIKGISKSHCIFHQHRSLVSRQHRSLVSK